MAPEGISIHAARVAFGAMAAGRAIDSATPLAALGARTFAEPPSVDEAVELLAAAPLHVIAYGFTSSSYILGPDGDLALRERLEKRSGGIPVLLTCPAVVLALRAFGVQRLALVDPPWFSVELTQLGKAYFEGQGMEVVHAAPVGFLVGTGQRDVHPGQLYEWVRAHVPKTAEAVFIGGNGFRAIGVIQVLEEDLGRPVLTANQVLFWHALHSQAYKHRSWATAGCSLAQRRTKGCLSLVNDDIRHWV